LEDSRGILGGTSGGPEGARDVDVKSVFGTGVGRSAPGSSARSQVLQAVRRTRRVYARDESEIVCL
jgi:hypothetical protein